MRDVEDFALRASRRGALRGERTIAAPRGGRPFAARTTWGSRAGRIACSRGSARLWEGTGGYGDERRGRAATAAGGGPLPVDGGERPRLRHLLPRPRRQGVDLEPRGRGG